MTAQDPDKLLNECPTLDVEGLYLFGIIRGDIDTNHGWGEPYVFESTPKAKDEQYWCSSLWRGHVASYRIEANGRVTLLRYDYPYHYHLPEEERTEDLSEELSGDFWLVFKDCFFGPRVYLPACDGRVVADRSRWRREPDEGHNCFGDI